jgi:hypothetical protein
MNLAGDATPGTPRRGSARPTWKGGTAPKDTAGRRPRRLKRGESFPHQINFILEKARKYSDKFLFYMYHITY